MMHLGPSIITYLRHLPESMVVCAGSLKFAQHLNYSMAVQLDLHLNQEATCLRRLDHKLHAACAKVCIFFSVHRQLTMWCIQSVYICATDDVLTMKETLQGTLIFQVGAALVCALAVSRR